MSLDRSAWSCSWFRWLPWEAEGTCLQTLSLSCIQCFSNIDGHFSPKGSSSPQVLACPKSRESWIIDRFCPGGSHLDSFRFTFVDDLECVWWDWITVFSWEERESMDSICTNRFLHLDELSENTTYWPYIDRFAVPFFKKNDFRSTIPPGSHSQGQLDERIVHILSSLDLGLHCDALLAFFCSCCLGILSGETFLPGFSCFWRWFFRLFLSLFLDSIIIQKLHLIFLSFIFLLITFLILFMSQFLNNSSQPKITYFNHKSLSINKDISRFEIPMYNISWMQIFQSKISK